MGVQLTLDIRIQGVEEIAEQFRFFFLRLSVRRENVDKRAPDAPSYNNGTFQFWRCRMLMLSDSGRHTFGQKHYVLCGQCKAMALTYPYFLLHQGPVRFSGSKQQRMAHRIERVFIVEANKLNG